MLSSLTLAVALAASPLPPAAISLDAAWWDLGHRLVARLADTRLTPRARAAVHQILEGQSLADASVWADNIKNYRHDADPLHYINIPLGDTVYVPQRHCPTGRCIIVAIETERRMLADPATSPAARAEALRFLIHFLGDLHQPLHVGDDHDRGGNDRPVILLGHATNLHKAWDGEMIDSLGLTQESYFNYLRKRMASIDTKAMERGSVSEWAMEGHQIAVRDVYGKLPRDGRIGRDYLRESRPIIDRQLIAAGVRLAAVLNQALAKYRPR
jgi:nuclease S1